MLRVINSIDYLCSAIMFFLFFPRTTSAAVPKAQHPLFGSNVLTKHIIINKFQL